MLEIDLLFSDDSLMKVINFIGQGVGGGGWHESNTFNRPKYFFSIKIRCQQKVICVSGEGMCVLLYAVKMYLAFGLMLKKKLLPLMIELVVVLNQLGVMHLQKPQKMANFVTLYHCLTYGRGIEFFSVTFLQKNENYA